jgi:uncharacterized tellurite resistance protein B-like protein
MFKFFKNKDKDEERLENNSDIKFEFELTASVLAYEVARSDGNISKSELSLLYDEIKKISVKVNKEENKILQVIEEYSENNVSFYEFVRDINKQYSKEKKLSLIQFLFDVAYADKILEVTEERLIRRIADLINIKDFEVLKIKDLSKRNLEN